MPWKNQGGGPWGSGPKGPWGSGPQPSGQGRPISRTFCAALRTAAAIVAGRLFQRPGYRAGSDRRLGDLGTVRIFPRPVRRARCRAALWQACAYGAAGPELSPAVSDRDRAAAKALRVSTISIGMTLIDDPARRGRTMRDVPEESLMLTGDENIVDVDFTVLWRIKPDGVGDYLFNIQNPEGTVKAVAESAMREVVGRSNIQPILTGARTSNEQGVQDLMQRTLDSYGSGIQVTQVQMQKVDPPAQVIDSFRDVQARAPISSGCRTKPRPMPTASSPMQRDAPRKSCRSPKATSSRRRRGQGPKRALPEGL